MFLAYVMLNIICFYVFMFSGMLQYYNMVILYMVHNLLKYTYNTVSLWRTPTNSMLPKLSSMGGSTLTLPILFTEYGTVLQYGNIVYGT